MCGESTVMGTGSPSVTISGVSAANMVLRRLGMKEYIWRKGMKDYVKEYRTSDLPQLKSLSHIRPNALEDERFRELHDNASLCQWCEDAPCLYVCPAEYDIRGMLRRIEVGNYQGAHSLLKTENREKEIKELNCIDCIGYCYDACAGKSGITPPVDIKNIFINLDRMLKSESI
jgi:prolycopene isomerase